MKDRLDMLAALQQSVDCWFEPPRFTLKRLGEYLTALGWTVTLERREEQGAGIKQGRVFIREPGSYAFIYFHALKGAAVIERGSSLTRLSRVAADTLRALGFHRTQDGWAQRVAEVPQIPLA